MDETPIECYTFQAGDLKRYHPPKWRDQNKLIVYKIATTSNIPFEGEITMARWKEKVPPGGFNTEVGFSVQPGIFDYQTKSDPNLVSWYMNFADPQLFVAYGSSLMAQDEIQVAEHPTLGSIREALIARGQLLMTFGEGRRPTPITITGVQRRCAIDTRPNPIVGIEQSLYGNAFKYATEEQIKCAVQPLIPPTISNIHAMSAPYGGHNEYIRDEIEYVLKTAFTGFSAAHSESVRLTGEGARSIINTGFWGCGAFGGNRTLMTILQALAGGLAKVDVVFWALDQAGFQTAKKAHDQYLNLRNDSLSVSDLIDKLVKNKYLWGESDGN